MGPEYHTNGNVDSFQVTSTRHSGPEDDIEHVYITNVKTNYTASPCAPATTRASTTSTSTA